MSRRGARSVLGSWVSLAAIACVAIAGALGVAHAQEPNRRYAEDNARLGNPRPGERRVVFFGSSSIQGWNLAREFPGEPFVNRGISGENTRQMLARFDADVVGLKPSVVVIHLGGANDIGAIRREETLANLRTMIGRARAAKIAVVLMSPTPSRGHYAVTRTPAKIRELREQMRTLANEEKVTFHDIYPLVADADGYLRADLTSDGLHLKRKGYELLTQSTRDAIATACASRSKGLTGSVKAP